jgi:putative ABC transport system permease protein
VHEVGIRMALDAGARDVLSLVLGQSRSLTLAGVGLGIAGSLVLTHLISTLLFQVKTTDVATLSAVAAVLTAAALLASYVPFQRAAAVDPVVALRQE